MFEMFKKKIVEDIIVDLVVYISLIFVGIVILYFFLNVFVILFNDVFDIVCGGIYIWLRKWILKNYEIIVSNL